MFLAVVPCRNATGRFQFIAFKVQHFCHRVTFLCQLTGSNAHQVTVSEFIRQHCTGGAKGTAPFASINAVLLLQPRFLLRSSGDGRGDLIQIAGIFSVDSFCLIKTVK